MMIFIQQAILRLPVQPPDRSTFRTPLAAADESRLQSLAERVRWLDMLDRHLRQSLPPELASQCRLANVRDGRLVFLIRAAAATKLRLHTPTLLAAARAAGVEASALTVKVATMQPVPPGATPHSPLSPAAGNCLRAAALATSDPALREQLLRLASLAKE